MCVCVCGKYLMHGPCRYKDRVSQELNDCPALDAMLIQQPLTLLPAQVPCVLSDGVLVQRHVQTLLLRELRWLLLKGRKRVF